MYRYQGKMIDVDSIYRFLDRLSGGLKAVVEQIAFAHTYEGHTLIPFLEAISRKFNLGKPVVVADAGLLTGKNIEALQEGEYKYIIALRKTGKIALL